MSTHRPPRRYLAGFVIAQMDSEIWGEDKIAKRLFVQAQENAVGAYDLVAYIEVEIFGAQEHIADHKFPVEVSRLPFIYDPNIRKAVVKLIRIHEKYLRA